MPMHRCSQRFVVSHVDTSCYIHFVGTSSTSWWGANINTAIILFDYEENAVVQECLLIILQMNVNNKVPSEKKVTELTSKNWNPKAWILLGILLPIFFSPFVFAVPGKQGSPQQTEKVHGFPELISSCEFQPPYFSSNLAAMPSEQEDCTSKCSHFLPLIYLANLQRTNS